MGVARVLHGGGFRGGQFVGRAIATAVLHEDKRAVVDDEVIFKESISTAEALFEQAPQAPPTDLRLFAGEADDAAFKMFVLGLADVFVDAHPITHCRDLAKWHTGLCHAPRAGIHTDKYDFFPAAAKASQIGLMRCPGVVERAIDMRRRCCESQRAAVTS